MTIISENGAIWFEFSGCPDQICVRTGKLSRASESAACLPAGVVIKVESGRNSP